MDIKEYLQSIAKRERKLEAMKQTHEQLLRIAEGGGTPKLDDLPGNSSPDGSAMANLVCKAVDLECRIKAEQEELDKNKCVILEALTTLSDAELQAVILMRYFNHLQWKDVAENTGHSISWVYQAHGEALSQLRLKLEVVA